MRLLPLMATLTFVLFHSSANAQWIVVNPPSAWGNVYGVGVPSNNAGYSCNGNIPVLFTYDAAGNRILREATNATVIKSKKEGKSDTDIGNVVEKQSADIALNTSNIFVYPNPTVDLITVQQKEAFVEGTLELYNSKGQLLQKKSAGVNTDLEMTNLSPGFYVLILRSGKATAQWKISKI